MKKLLIIPLIFIASFGYSQIDTLIGLKGKLVKDTALTIDGNYITTPSSTHVSFDSSKVVTSVVLNGTGDSIYIFKGEIKIGVIKLGSGGGGGGGITDSAYFWSRTGNVPNPGTDYLGTKTPITLRFRTNNIERLVIDSSTGFIGKGISVPAYLMDLRDSANAARRLNIQNNHAGTSSSAIFQATNDLGNALQFGETSSGLTATGNLLPNTGFVNSNGKALVLGATQDSILFSLAGSQLASFKQNMLVLRPSVKLGIGVNTPSYIIHAVDNVNGATRLLLQNANAGSSAQGLLELDNNLGNATQIGITSSTFTTSGLSLPNQTYIQNSSGPILIKTGTTSDMVFATTSIERARFLAAGALRFVAGTAIANTEPIQFTAGAPLATPISGAVETNANNELMYSTSTATYSRGFVSVERYRATATNFTATANDRTLDCSGTMTLTLPTSVGIAGRIYIITNSGSGTITVATTSSQTFTNVTATPTTLTMSTVGAITVQSDGANWLEIGKL